MTIIILNDTTLREQIFLAVRNLKETTEKTSEILTEIKQVVSEVNRGRGLAGWLINDTLTQQKVKSTLSELEKASIEIQASSRSLNHLITDLSNGEGSVPALMKDTAMVNDLRQTLKNLTVGTEKFNEDMEALQHHFLFQKILQREKQKMTFFKDSSLLKSLETVPPVVG